MKIAVTGKGGVGKTTLSSGLALLFAAEGRRVIAIDADPDANLAATLGFPEPEKIVPLIEMKDLIAERTGAQPGSFGAYFKLNPKVDDIPEDHCVEHRGIKLLVMGAAKGGGTGCFCPESAFLRALLAHLLVGRDDVVILDMEAGIEHLSRGTAQGVDALLIAVEPSRRSIETAFRIKELAADLRVRKVFVVANKVQEPVDTAFIERHTSGLEFLGSICYNKEVVDGMDERTLEEIRRIKKRLTEKLEEAFSGQ